MARVSAAQLDAIFVDVVQAAEETGLDVTRWSFGHHFGLHLTFVSDKDRPTSVFGTWTSPADAEIGLRAMLAAFEMVNRQPKA